MAVSKQELKKMLSELKYNEFDEIDYDYLTIDQAEKEGVLFCPECGCRKIRKDSSTENAMFRKSSMLLCGGCGIDIGVYEYSNCDTFTHMLHEKGCRDGYLEDLG